MELLKNFDRNSVWKSRWLYLCICFSNKKVPDKSDDLLIGGRFFGQSMSLVLVLCPEYFRHIDNNAFLSHIKTLKIWIS